jgi:hypothetical protein
LNPKEASSQGQNIRKPGTTNERNITQIGIFGITKWNYSWLAPSNQKKKKPPSATAEPDTVHLHRSTFRARGWTTNDMNNSLVA